MTKKYKIKVIGLNYENFSIWGFDDSNIFNENDKYFVVIANSDLISIQSIFCNNLEEIEDLKKDGNIILTQKRISKPKKLFPEIEKIEDEEGLILTYDISDFSTFLCLDKKNIEKVIVSYFSEIKIESLEPYEYLNIYCKDQMLELNKKIIKLDRNKISDKSNEEVYIIGFEKIELTNEADLSGNSKNIIKIEKNNESYYLLVNDMNTITSESFIDWNVSIIGRLYNFSYMIPPIKENFINKNNKINYLNLNKYPFIITCKNGWIHQFFSIESNKYFSIEELLNNYKNILKK